jgi:hypothetical protein
MQRSGYALATVLVLLGVALFGVGALVTISGLEAKIYRSNAEGIKAYYVAEAGVEDGLWRLNNTPTYYSALADGVLDVTYTATNQPSAGQSFTVHLYTSPTHGKGYAEVESSGSSDNGTFIAHRQIKSYVFMGPIVSPTGNNFGIAGGGISITNGGAKVTVIGGDLYASGNITVNSATLDVGSNLIQAVGSFNANNNATIISGGIKASNWPPAPPPSVPPGFDFNYYGVSPHYDQYYTANAFQTLINNAANNTAITLPGPITYVNGDVNLGSIAKTKTLQVTGMLIINGSFKATASNFTFNITDPGNGKAGLFVRQDLTDSAGSWNIGGVVYSSGKINFLTTDSTSVDGAVIAAGDFNMNVGLPLTLHYDPAKVIAVFGAGQAIAVQQQHWEEEY